MNHRLAPRNPLPCPEIAGHTTRAGIVSYAVRMPGERDWQGVASIGGPTIRTLEGYGDPRAAIDAIVSAVEAGRRDR